MNASPSAASVQRYVKAAGFLYLLTMVCGFFGEAYVPSRIFVASDAAATARNIIASEGLYRLGFMAYLVEAACDISLALVMYVLLKPVNRNLSLLAAFFSLVATATYAVAEMFYYAPLVILDASQGEALSGFSPEQLSSLAYFCLRLSARIVAIFMGLYGVAACIRGFLIIRSTYLPSALGVLLVVAGAGFIARNVTALLAPAWSTNLFIIPMAVAGLSLMTWMLTRGVDLARWGEVQGTTPANP